MRCVYCGDSEKNRNKARGYIFENKGSYLYHCHNCGVSSNFKTFLETVDYALYQDYIKEKISLREFKGETQRQKRPEYRTDYLKDLVPVSDLASDHYCRAYLAQRKIPFQFYPRLFFCPKFKEWVNSIIPNKFENTNYDSGRVIIPFYNKERKPFGFQGRSLDKKDKVRYITIITDEGMPRFYGLDRVDFNRRYYVLEGPFDSMFVSNAIACCGADMTSSLVQLGSNKSNCVIVYDNEPRNKEILRKVRGCIDKGYKVVIWPNTYEEKDVNDGILAGYTPSELQHIMDTNTYSGLAALTKFTEWKKI